MVEKNATIEKHREEEDNDFRFFVKRFNKFLRNKRKEEIQPIKDWRKEKRKKLKGKKEKHTERFFVPDNV